MDIKERVPTEIQECMRYFQRSADALVTSALAHGVILTISTKPRLPLAMGNYDLVVDVRERRVMAEPIVRTPAKKYSNRRFEADPMRNETLLAPGTTEVYDA